MSTGNGAYKVRQCRHFEKGHCKRGDSCEFAHGTDDVIHPTLTKFSWRVPFGEKVVVVSVLAHSVNLAKRSAAARLAAIINNAGRVEVKIGAFPGPKDEAEFAYWRSALGTVMTTSPEAAIEDLVAMRYV